MTVNPDGTIQEIRINGIDTGNPHFGIIDASYVLNRGYDYLQLLPTKLTPYAVPRLNLSGSVVFPGL